MAHESHYEEDTIISQFWGWVLLIGLSASLLGWMMLLMFIIPDAPRHWDFGALPDTPAASIYSTAKPAEPDAIMQQLPTLPEAEPLQPAPASRSVSASHAEDQP